MATGSLQRLSPVGGQGNCCRFLVFYLAVSTLQCGVLGVDCSLAGEASATGAWSAQGRAAPVSIAWSGTPLREAIARFGRVQGVAILIDRRVDPDQRLVVSIDSVPASDALAQIATTRGLQASHLGPVAYLGPADPAARLRTLAALRSADVARLPPAAARRFAQKQPWRWEDLDSPRQLLQILGQRAGIGVHGLELVPHDLWPATELPPLTLVDRLTLVTNQFDLTFVVASDGGSVRLVPIEPPVGIERQYRHARLNRALVSDLAADLTGATWRFDSGGLVLRGRVEDHERLLAALEPRSRPSRPAGGRRDRSVQGSENRYTMTVKDQPIGPLVRQLAKQLKIDVDIDGADIRKAGRSLATRVSFHVRDATVDQLFRAALRPAGLDFTRRGRRLQIVPSGP